MAVGGLQRLAILIEASYSQELRIAGSSPSRVECHHSKSLLATTHPGEQVTIGSGHQTGGALTSRTSDQIVYRIDVTFPVDDRACQVISASVDIDAAHRPGDHRSFTGGIHHCTEDAQVLLFLGKNDRGLVEHISVRSDAALHRSHCRG